MQSEEESKRLTVIINLYKEKLAKRETENRNLLVELRIFKEKVETIRAEFINQIDDLKRELETKTKQW